MKSYLGYYILDTSASIVSFNGAFNHCFNLFKEHILSEGLVGTTLVTDHSNFRPSKPFSHKVVDFKRNSSDKAYISLSRHDYKQQIFKLP